MMRKIRLKTYFIIIAVYFTNFAISQNSLLEEINYNNKTKIVSLLPTAIVASQEEQLQKAIENLEYSFLSATNNILREKQKKVVLLTGNGQLQDIYQYSFFASTYRRISIDILFC